MSIILDDFHAKVIGGGIIGTITLEGGSMSFGHNYKLIEVWML